MKKSTALALGLVLLSGCSRQCGRPAARAPQIPVKDVVEARGAQLPNGKTIVAAAPNRVFDALIPLAVQQRLNENGMAVFQTSLAMEEIRNFYTYHYAKGAVEIFTAGSGFSVEPAAGSQFGFVIRVAELDGMRQMTMFKTSR